MSTKADRINALIKDKGLKKRELAKSLNVSDAAISQICSGKTQPSDQTLRMISSIYSVNETWLLTGEGEMYAPLSRADEIAQVTAKMYNADPDSYPYKIAMKLASLNEDQWEMIRQVIEIFSEGK